MDAPKIETYGNLRGDKAQSTMVYKQDGLAPTLCGSVHGSGLPYIIVLGNLGGGKTQSRTVYDKEYLSPTLCSGMDHGNTVPFVVVEDELFRCSPKCNNKKI